MKRKVKKRSNRKLEQWRFTPQWVMPVVQRPEFIENIEMRRLEYLDAITDLSGAKEGNELESLSNITHELCKSTPYRENFEFEENEGDYEFSNSTRME